MDIKAKNLRQYLHCKSFKYSTNKYPFKEKLEVLYGIPLESIHEFIGSFEKFERKNDQNTLAHKVFYSNFKQIIEPLYLEFIQDVIKDIIYPYKFYFQKIPTFRLGLPGNTFVGEYHRDSHYNHQSYEINFNLGLSNYLGEASLRTEYTPNKKDWKLLECPYGSIFSFDHIDCTHGSEPNRSNLSMTSFDFRIALFDLYFESDSSSVNMNTQFRPGSYFSNYLIN
mgnify:CR=1 FL=1